jgi:hypothetical protein
MTNIQKLIKTLNFINHNSCSIPIHRDFIIEDGLPYKVIGYFYDYHKGNYEIIRKESITEEKAEQYLCWPSIQENINNILIQRELAIAKKDRLEKFYASDES